MNLYENAMVEARVTVAQRLTDLIVSINGNNIGFFLIYCMLLRTMMSESVGNMLIRASNIDQQGIKSVLVELLVDDAEQAYKERDELHADAEDWIQWWRPQCDRLLSEAVVQEYQMIPALDAYQKVHADIKGAVPVVALAVFYETQRLEFIYSESLIQLSRLHLGAQAVRRLGFIHRALENRETDLAAHQALLQTFFNEQSETRGFITNTVAASLRSYVNVINAARELGDQVVARYCDDTVSIC